MTRYDLQRWFVDQRPTLVRPLCAPLLVALNGSAPSENGVHTVDVDLIEAPGGPVTRAAFEIGWELRSIRAHNAHLDDELQSIVAQATPLNEDITKLAAYGVATCAIGVFLNARRIVAYNYYRTPDILLSDAGDAGVEVAGRKSGKRGVLQRLADGDSSAPAGTSRHQGKRRWLLRSPGLVEGYLSLWAFDGPVGLHERVK